MLRKIKELLLKKKLTRQYYEDKAQEVMEEYLKENKDCFAIRDIQGKIISIRSYNYHYINK